MIAYLHGAVMDKTERSLLLEVRGVGYEVFVAEALRMHVSIGQELSLYTFFSVRDTAQELFGFADKETKKMFLLLLDVPGVGPKSAMNILDALTPSDIVSAVLQHKPEFLVVKGLGLKTAEKIAHALKDKLRSFSLDANDAAPLDNDFIAALETLGYNASQIKEVLANIPVSAVSTEEKVKEALKCLTH